MVWNVRTTSSQYYFFRISCFQIQPVFPDKQWDSKNAKRNLAIPVSRGSTWNCCWTIQQYRAYIYRNASMLTVCIHELDIHTHVTITTTLQTDAFGLCTSSQPCHVSNRALVIFIICSWCKTYYYIVFMFLSRDQFLRRLNYRRMRPHQCNPVVSDSATRFSFLYWPMNKKHG